MSRVVLDASAILALVNRERGHDKLTPELLERSVVSMVNLTEVQGKLVSQGWPGNLAWLDATSFITSIIPFDQKQARIAGDLILRTKPLGLSLGDRACLALAIVIGAQVYTAENIWARLALDVPINVIR